MSDIYKTDVEGIIILTGRSYQAYKTCANTVHPGYYIDIF